ncbi:MAG: DUF4957 domain-containing protein [Bacteroidales bacterium]|nr:DUF4957 domain-containing protein [Bacteroidales bacterium]
MKYRIYSLLAAITALFAVSCVEEIPAVIEEVDLSRCLVPTNVTAVVKNGEYVNFNWDKAKTTEVFELELYTNEAMEGDPAFTFNLTKDEIPYLAHLEADVVYWFRVRGTSGTKDPSKWYVHGSSLETSAVKSALAPELTDRSASSISMKWTADPEVDHVRIVPPLGNDSGYTRFDLSSAMVDAAAAEITGLNPSTYYTLTLHFKSAERGEVHAWTRPDMTGTVEVADTAALRAALNDKAPKIKMVWTEKPYDLEEFTLSGPVAIYGEETISGQKPVCHTAFNADPAAVGSIHFENIAFDGEGYGHNITMTKAGTMTDISLLNCEIYGYSKGIYSDAKGVSVNSIVYDHCLVHDIEGNGGDCFDVRSACNIGSVKFTNSTFYEGMRTFVRIDASPKLESLEISNCTLSHLVHIENGNTNGVIHVRAKNAANGDPAIILKKNLFLNFNYDGSGTSRCTLIGTNTADKLPTEVSKNWCYNCADAFFSHLVSSVETLGAEKVLANGGALLGEDPCKDSEGGLFYVTSSAVAAAGAGDPRWYEAYVEVPEDLTQDVTVPVKTWNLTDNKLFRKTADKDMVRDGIRFYVTANPVNFTAEGFQFTAVPAFSAGVPTDCAIGIKVDRPGSVVLSTASQEDSQSLLVVNADGKVVAGVPTGVQNTRIALPELAEGSEHMIYLYGTAPIVLSGLQWTDDVDTGDTQLAAPVVTLSATEIEEGSTTPLEVSWEEVPKAGSYQVLFNGNTWPVTGTSLSVDISKYAADSYQLGVQALPAETDLVRQPSEVSYVILVIKETLKPVSATGPTVWGAGYMQAGVTKFGNGTEITANVVYGNLNLLCGGGKFKFGIDNADSDSPLYRLQLAGTGAPGTKVCAQFIAGGAGTLEIVARSSGDDARGLAVAVGSTLVSAQNSATKSQDPGKLSWEVNSSDGDIISIYSTNKGINLYSISWTPAVGDDPGDTPAEIDDPDAINEEYNADYKDAEKFPAGAFEDARLVDKVTYCGGSGAAMNFDPSGKRVKFNGASPLGDDGIPTARFVSFKITKPGTITHKLISGSSSAADREGVILLVTKTADGQKVTTLWNAAVPTSSSSAALTTAVTAEHLAGITEAAKVYIYVKAGVNLYNLGYKPE